MTAAAQPLDPAAYRRVLDVTRQLAAPLELDELLLLITSVAVDLIAAERATVFTLDAAAGELVAKVAHGQPDLCVPADRGIAGDTVRLRRLVHVRDCYGDARFNPAVDRVTGYTTRSMLSMPMIASDGAVVGVMQVLNATDGAFSASDEELVEVFAAQAAVALQRSMLFEDRLARQKLQRDLEVARSIQRSSLPDALPEVQGYELAAHFQPADEAGGDAYDALVDAQGRLWVLVGDATGHGIGPALSAAQLRAMFRMGLRLGATLPQIIGHVNAQLAADVPAGRFVTAVIGVLDPRTHVFEYVSGGQGPIVQVRADGSCEARDATTVPLGVIDDIDTSRTESITLRPGEALALFSDGVYERMDRGDRQFALEGVKGVLCETLRESAEGSVGAMVRALSEHADGLPASDDVTMLLIKRKS